MVIRERYLKLIRPFYEQELKSQNYFGNALQNQILNI